MRSGSRTAGTARRDGCGSGRRPCRPCPRRRSSSARSRSSWIAAASRSVSSSVSSVEALNGLSRARRRISFACALPIPASARWSRRRGWSWRRSRLRISPSAAASSSSASGPRWARSASSCSGVVSQTPARFFLPPSVRMSSPPPEKREPEHRALRPFRSRLQVADPARAHQVHAQDELAVLGREEQVLRAPLGTREPSACRASRAAGRSSSASRRARARRARSGTPRRADRARAPRPRPRAAQASGTSVGTGACWRTASSMGPIERTGESRRGRKLSDPPIAPDPERRPEPDGRGENASGERAERDHAPHDEPSRRVQAAEQAIGGDGLLEAEAGDVEHDAAEASEDERRDEERDRLRLRRSGHEQERGPEEQRRADERRPDPEPRREPAGGNRAERASRRFRFRGRAR